MSVLDVRSNTKINKIIFGSCGESLANASDSRGTAFYIQNQNDEEVLEITLSEARDLVKAIEKAADIWGDEDGY